MTNDNSIADGIPMSLEQMRLYLQELYGISIVLRKQGTTIVKCPCCSKMHDHGPQPEHHVALCEEADRCKVNGIGIVIVERYFVPNYGYTIYEYRERDGVNEFIIPE